MKRIGLLSLLTVALATTSLHADTIYDDPQVADRPAEQTVRSLPKIAFTKRHHLAKPFGVGTVYCWSVYRPGGGLFIYDPAHPEQEPRMIFDAAKGVIFDMSLSYDAKKILFSYMRLTRDPELDKEKLGYRGNVDSFHLYEIGVDGCGLKQLTFGRYHDVSPVYLPDGRICFTSTRGESYSMCQPGLSSALYTCKADGTDMIRIEHSTLASMTPFVLDDGSILYMRWEYQDKSLFTLQGLWTVNPDGTRVRLFYGNTITNPNVIWQAKAVPGRPNHVLATLGPHHGNPVGAIGLINRSLGTENPEATTNLTPEFDFTPSKAVHTGGGPGDKQYVWAFRDPWPVTKDVALVAYGGPAKDGPGRYRLFAIDYEGNKTQVYEDEQISCFHPMPIVERPTPRRIIPIARSESPKGTFLVTDVYQGLLEYGIERGTVKEIRVLTQVPKRCNMRGHRQWDHDPLISRGSYYVKRIVGRAPVEPDGSAHFEAPAGIELYFEALDEAGREICRMGSVTQLMPGERQSCIGCHESRDAIIPPPKGIPAAMRRAPSKLKPAPFGGDGTVDYVKHVQPVFDRHCVRCHSGETPGAQLDLSGDKTRFFNMSYENLLSKNWVHFIYINKGLTDFFRPLETGCPKSRLVAHLEQGCPGNQGKIIPDRDRRIIYAWIDANCSYYSTYANTRPGTPGSRDLYRGGWYGELNAAGLGRPNDYDVNFTRPECSPLLLKNLSATAGGWHTGDAPLKSKSEERYVKALEAITKGKAELDARPRVDMPGAKPVDYPVDYGGLYKGFAGP